MVTVMCSGVLTLRASKLLLISAPSNLVCRSALDVSAPRSLPNETGDRTNNKPSFPVLTNGQTYKTGELSNHDNKEPALCTLRGQIYCKSITSTQTLISHFCYHAMLPSLYSWIYTFSNAIASWSMHRSKTDGWTSNILSQGHPSIVVC